MSRRALFVFSLCLAATTVVAQPTSGTGSFHAVSLGPEGGPLSAYAKLVEVADAGVYASGGVLLTDEGEFDVSVKRWTGDGWAGVGDLRGEVVALESAPDGTLYAVGNVGGGSSMARWDGEAWHEFGFGNAARVQDVAVAPDGTVAVIALGAWPAEDVTVRVYRDAVWQTLGEPFPVRPTDLAIASGDEVYISDGPVVRRWDGTSWVSLGDTFDGPVQSLVLGGAGLVGAGDFTSVGAVSAANIAVWDGAAWAAVGSGLPGPALKLDAAGDRIVALSLVSEAGPLFLGVWDGAGWSLEDLVSNGQTYDVALAAAGDVYIAGAFFDAAFGDVSAVQKRAGDGWAPLGAAVNGWVQSFARGEGGRPVMSGMFTTAGDVSAVRVAQKELEGWSALGAGMPRTSFSGTVLARGADGRLYAGGRFVVPGDGFRTLAVWDGSAWTLLGPASERAVFALHLGPDGSLYGALGLGEQTVARWSGSEWVQVGDAFEAGGIQTLTTAPDGRLCAGGGFTAVGAASIEGVACWTGVAWGPLGASLDLPEGFGASVMSLVFGTDGTPFAGGISVGGGGVGVVSWTGTEWAPLPDIPMIDVTAMTAHPDGSVYAAGNVATNSSAQRFSRWDGEAWETVGLAPDLSGSVGALWVDDAGSIWVGGKFQTLGGVYSPNVIRYDPPSSVATAPQAAAGSALRIAPNPVSGRGARLLADVPAGTAEVSIYDALGRRIAVVFDGETSGTLSVTLEPGGLAPGLYVARLRAGGAVTTTRFVVTR